MNPTIKLKNILALLLFFVAITFYQSCGTKAFGLQADSLFLVTDHSSFYYELKKPDEKHFLPYVLSEISGLTFTPKNTLLAVDDETGKVFEYDPKKREIIHSIEFARPGDYEGVELVNDQIFVLESDGDLYSFTYSEVKEVIADKMENILERANDTEGLGFDAANNSLLIVCKEKGEVGGNKAKGRSVYSCDLSTGELHDDPIFSIRTKDLKKFWEKSKGFDYEEERIKFKPSAIAIHPIEDKIYVLASVGKLLVILNRDGSIHATYPISARVLSQPEGLCFAPNGDMYISSEGEGDRGYILKYSMKKK